MIAEGPWREDGDADSMWAKMATHIRKVAREVLGVTKGRKQEPKDTWWWNEDVQKAIKEKKECYKSWFQDRSASILEKYKEAKRNARQAVSGARGKAYDKLHQKLGTKEGEMEVYKMAKIRERKTRDLNQVKCIKDEADRVLVKDEKIKKCWRDYFDGLFNDGNESFRTELEDPRG